MATVYIPDHLDTEIHRAVFRQFPDAGTKELSSQRSKLVAASIREKLDRDGGEAFV